ncbi:MAG TPA: 16S rRNA (cytosine(1402)-N(4))-methyltransferase RsmH [Chitinophagaceae bacterium]|nr:16S rRNA (cytosine(1402)-N(4))-methyltransferase RsmH [Chitinophagaceae bacterium]
MGKRKTIASDSAGKARREDSPVTSYHIPVLLEETLEGLSIKPDGVYVDCTFGGGGHARGILARLGNAGRLVAFDQDPDAAANLPQDTRLIFVPHNFRHLQRFLRFHGIPAVDGIVADLGVSSHQFDLPDRGFSTRFDAKLDMRMDPRQDLTAEQVVNTYGEEVLHKLFEQYGEVTNARTLARTIVAARTLAPIRTIENFKNALRGIVKGNPNKYFAQVFQALRIEVNDELGSLKEMLQQVPGVLKPGGRAAIITFHSLEDRLVKNFFRRGSFDEPEPNPFFNTETVNLLRLVHKKPILPSSEEIRRNPRSASAKLRIAERVEAV